MLRRSLWNVLAKHGGLDIGPKRQESSHRQGIHHAVAQCLFYLNPSSLRPQLLRFCWIPEFLTDLPTRSPTRTLLKLIRCVLNPLSALHYFYFTPPLSFFVLSSWSTSSSSSFSKVITLVSIYKTLFRFHPWVLLHMDTECQVDVCLSPKSTLQIMVHHRIAQQNIF